MSKINTFGKNEIAKKIGKKINNTIPKRLLFDIIEIINNFISDEVSANRVFSVNKFGTFYQATRKPQLVWSNFYQKKVMTRPSRQVKFAKHDVFSKLLKSKRKNIIETLKTEKE
jgi:nucleoid DNA-binding protein